MYETFLKHCNLTVLTVFNDANCMLIYVILFTDYFFLEQPVFSGRACWIKTTKYMSDLIFVFSEVTWETL